MRFELGKCVATRGALAVMEHEDVGYFDILRRHVRGDWGDLGREDKASNDAALVRGGRLVSAYNLPKGGRVWVITEWDRSVTTILLPAEY